jgi:haloalkane dehalogenase
VNGVPHFERFSKLMGGAMGGFFIRRFNAFVNLLIPAGIKRHKVAHEVMEAYRAPFRATSPEPTHILPGEILRSRSFLEEVEGALPRLVDRPALILWGDKDIAFRPMERARFEQLFPNHQSPTLKGAGHFIQEDAPDEIISAITSWWSSLGPL